MRKNKKKDIIVDVFNKIFACIYEELTTLLQLKVKRKQKKLIVFFY